ncbi:MAG: DUF2314 domain-containing protein [Thermodesulfobacteriota bacterium]
MIQLRCPECGYLQNVSERRYFSGSEEPIICPHCATPMPPQRLRTEDEPIPEDVAHKILAFSSRILSGGDISKEVVLALEAMIRHYGPTVEGVKALGIGFTRLGEPRKAEPFLMRALAAKPEEVDLVRCLLTVQLAKSDYAQAVRTGTHLLTVLGAQTADEDVAKLVLGHLGMGAIDKARALLEAHPALDSDSPLVKHVLKELKRGSGTGFGGVIRPLKRLWGNKSAKSLQSFGRRALDLVTRNRERSGVPAGRPDRKATAPVAERSKPLAATQQQPESVLEYWIFAPGTEVPGWGAVRDYLDKSLSDRPDGQTFPKFLDEYLGKKRLTTDHLLKRDAPGSFEYPEELIPRNSRDLSADDRAKVVNAAMIVRVRLVIQECRSLDHIVTGVLAVEAVRSLTNGIVQDAISHTLWGTARWKADVVTNPLHNLVETHVRFDTLDEKGIAWIHSHGMQKFGLPEIEIEEVPTDYAPYGRRLMVGAARTLIERTLRGEPPMPPVELHRTPFLLDLEPRPGDEEGHFPVGSLQVFPYVADYDPRNPSTLRHVLRIMESRGYRFPELAPPPTPEPAEPPASAPPHAEKHVLKSRLLLAHRQAQQGLIEFKRSFLDQGHLEGAVHAVKVGFPVAEGEYEWMWVSLDKWTENLILGHVENDPVLRTDLSKGSRVEVEEGQVFDWVIAREGRVLGGAYTEALLSPPDVRHSAAAQ